MTLVATAPTASTTSSVIRMPSPGVRLAAQHPRGQRGRETVNDTEDPDQRGDADRPAAR